MQLSPHFTLAEMTVTNSGLPNKPDAQALARLTNTANQLEVVRSKVLLGNSITVNSGYRSEAVNRAVGGSPTSDHRLGDAADITCAGFGKPYEICIAIRDSGILYDQLIQEGTWVHISFGPRMRQMELTRRVKHGKTIYEVGIHR